MNSVLNMNKNSTILPCIIAVIVLGLATEAVSAGDLDVEKLRADAVKRIGAIPDKMPGCENDTQEQIALGKKLYFDTILSKDNTVSCNTCHLVDKSRAGVDGTPTSAGVNKKLGNRNSPTVLNAGFQSYQFWDGRAPDLKEQAKGPILNPVEMAMPDEAAVIAKLKKDANYPAEFKKAFPKDEDALTYDNLAHAIAAYERTLITRDRFDDFIKGDDNALTEDEQTGLRLFLDAGCAFCHSGPVLGGKTFHKIGLYETYPNKEDLGRFDTTQKKTDKFKFKTPMLRNIAITAPYFHDGNISTLEEAVDSMNKLQLKPGLSNEEKAKVVQFLRTLTDKERETK